MGRLAVKRLAAVEVEPRASHQHEFNASVLRRTLGIAEERVTGRLTIVFYLGNHQEPLVEETTYTLYDSRQMQVHRSPEFRMYYASPLIGRLARPGDLLVISRGSEHALHAVVARPGTDAERDLQRALLVDEQATFRRFLSVTPPQATLETGAELASALLPVTSDKLGTRVREFAAENATIRDALVRNKMPSTREMAEAAHRVVRETGGESLSPDELLQRALDAETTLYNEIEGRIAGRALELMVAGRELTFENVMKLAMKYFQSRKSRRGTSLQNHVAHVLRAADIPHTPQCVTERGEKPDFVVPGCAEYHDPSFPQVRLRMVACKSRTRERWDEVLNEAQRIPLKYLVSVDEDITDSAISKMVDSGVRPFLPQVIIGRHYADSSRRGDLGTIAKLVEELRLAVG